MAGLDVGSAVDLFMNLFTLSIWAAGFIMVAYMLSILKVVGQTVKKIRFGRR